MESTTPHLRSFVQRALLHVVLAFVAAVGGVSRLLSRLLPATELCGNDNVVLFTTAARMSNDRGDWIIPLHGWVHQLERDDSIRRTLIAGVLRLLGVASNAVEAQFLRDRLGWFLVDNKRSRLVRLRLAEREIVLGPTDPQGHFEGEFRLSVEQASPRMRGRTIEVEVVSKAHPPRSFLGFALLVDREGLGVISDVDDTVKVSHVLDRRALARNTFMRPFEPVSGMAAFYRQLAEQEASLHFISCSPWHLYPALEAFLGDSGFPPATIACRRLRLKDSTLQAFLSAPDAFKIPEICQLLEDYPDRRFLLVGDSGERDPEIYGQIARERPDRILGILIRNVTHASPEDPRWSEAFRGIERPRWQLFTDPRQIEWPQMRLPPPEERV